MATELNEVKEALGEIASAFEEFKKANDKRLEALKAEKSTADFDEKLDRINDTILKQGRVHDKWIQEQEAREAKRVAEEAAWQAARKEEERKFEARANRLMLGLGGSTDENAAKGQSILEKKAYDKFLRKGQQQMTPEEVKVLTVANDATGGYLAPPQYVAEIIKAIVLVSPFRGIVDVRQSGAAEYQQPKRTGTASATRVGEVATRSETNNPTWGLLKIPAPEMYAEARISTANLEDSAFNLESELAAEFSEQFAVLEGYEAVNGNGVGQMLGFLDPNAAGPATPIAYTVSGGATSIAGASGSEGDGMVKLFHAVKTGYAANGRWVLNRASLGSVRLLKDTQGRYLWQPGLMDGSPATILGAPYTEMPDMPNEGAGAFPVAFGDWKRAFKMVDRVEMVITRDPFTVADKGQVKFFARRRVGGQVVLGEAIRLLKCST